MNILIFLIIQKIIIKVGRVYSHIKFIHLTHSITKPTFLTIMIINCIYYTYNYNTFLLKKYTFNSIYLKH